MAKVQAAKPKSSGMGDFFKRFTSPKAKPAPARSASSTHTNLKAQPQAAAKPAARKPDAPAAPAMAGFRLPFIGGKPILVQLQVLGLVALALLAFVVILVFVDVNARAQNATYITITSQMQFHTQRLAKAAGIAARGQAAAFAQVQDSRDEFATYLEILQKGGFTFGQKVDPAGSNEEIRSRLDELGQRWPESAQSATAILAAQRDLVALAQNIAQIRVGSEEMATLSQELTGLMSQSGSAPGQVLRATG